MKAIFIVVFSFLAMVALVDVVFPRTELRPLADVLYEEINNASLLTYKDDLFGYSVCYPSCFRCDGGSQSSDSGYVRFRYNMIEDIILECYVTRAVGTDNTVVCDISGMGRRLHACPKSVGDGMYVLGGPLYENGVRIDGYKHYTKCVRKGKLWICCALLYPEQYKDSLGRIFRLVESWQPWNNVNCSGRTVA